MQDLKAEREQEWRIKLRHKMKNKEPTEIRRVKMPELGAVTRILYQYREVNSGLDAGSVRQEASRCMDCVNFTCINGCPVNINIPGFIKR